MKSLGRTRTPRAARSSTDLAQYVQGQSAEADPSDPALALALAWDAHMAFGLAHPAVFVLMSRAGRGGAASPAAEARLSTLLERVRRIAREGRLRISEPLAVQLVHAGGTGAVAALLQTAAEEGSEALPATMREAMMTLIVGDPPARPQTTSASLAIGLRARLTRPPVLPMGSEPCWASCWIAWQRLRAARLPETESPTEGLSEGFLNVTAAGRSTDTMVSCSSAVAPPTGPRTAAKHDAAVHEPA